MGPRQTLDRAVKSFNMRTLRWHLGRGVFALSPKLQQRYSVAVSMTGVDRVADAVVDQHEEATLELTPALVSYFKKYAAAGRCHFDGRTLRLPHRFRVFRLGDVAHLGHTGALIEKQHNRIVDITRLAPVGKPVDLPYYFRPFQFRSVEHVQGPALSILSGRTGHRHYAHFMLERLRLLMMALEAVPRLQSATLLHRPDLPAFQRAALEQLGKMYPALIFRSVAADVKLELAELYIPVESGDHTLTWFARQDAIAAVRDLYLDAYGVRGGAGSRHRKLYLSRNRQKKRRLRNEATVWPLLASQGYEFLYPENLPHRDQVTLMQETSDIFAPSGSALASTIFSPAGTNVFVTGPHDLHQPFWVGIALALGHTFTFAAGSSAGWRNGFTLPIDLISPPPP